MTNHVKIQGVTPRIQYTADGTSTDYEFPFAIFTSDDLDVYLDDTLQSTGSYSVNGIRHSDGGTVSFNEPPAIDTIITIIRNLSIERTTDFQEGGALRADVLNDELDYQAACQQQIADNLNRAFVLPPYINGDNVDLKLPEPDSGKAIVWNASGTGLENSNISINTWGNTLAGYKQAAETAAADAATYAQTATNAFTNATTAAVAAETAQIAAETAVSQMESLLSSNSGYSGDNVTLTDNQSIDGTKTFLNQLQTSTATEGGILCLNTAYDFSSAQNVSSDTVLFRFEGQDLNNKSTGGMTQIYQTDGNLTTQFGSQRYLNSAYVKASVTCQVNDSGVAQVTTQTPTSSLDSSDQIATTRWIENQRQTGNGIGLPDWNAIVTLGTSETHTIPTNGWVGSSGSIRLNTNTGRQICSGGSYVTVPISAGQKIYVSGVQAHFFPSL